MDLELKSNADFKKSEQVINTNHLCKFKTYRHKTIYFATAQKDTKRYKKIHITVVFCGIGKEQVMELKDISISR